MDGWLPGWLNGWSWSWSCSWRAGGGHCYTRLWLWLRVDIILGRLTHELRAVCLRRFFARVWGPQLEHLEFLQRERLSLLLRSNGGQPRRLPLPWQDVD